MRETDAVNALFGHVELVDCRHISQADLHRRDGKGYSDQTAYESQLTIYKCYTASKARSQSRAACHEMTPEP
jgi:hypothetical protein